MSVRRRILLAALAVGVVAIVVVLIWAEGRKDKTPKLEFTLLRHADPVEKDPAVVVSNLGRRSDSVRGFKILCESGESGQFGGSWVQPIVLGPDGSNRLGLPPHSAPFSGAERTRWRVQCFV